MSKQVNIRISDKQYDALNEKADIFGMSLTEYVRYIISMDLMDFMQSKYRAEKEEAESYE